MRDLNENIWKRRQVMNGPRARETVQKLWNASKSLQGGGVSYYEYVTELTYLLLLKMLEEVKRDGKKLEERLPADCRWGALKKAGRRSTA